MMSKFLSNMFWKKKEFERHQMWLMELEDYCKRHLWAKTDLVNQKLDLILDHLNLEYVPETEKTEPAKLIEKETPSDFDDLVYNMFGHCVDSRIKENKTKAPKKKKRGRPKKK